jgi:excisionase family DNA binding protein
MKKTINIEALEQKARIAELASRLTWLRIPEAAAYANMGQSKLYDLVNEGTIDSCKDDGTLVVHRRDIDKYYEDRRRSVTDKVNELNQSEPSVLPLQSAAA